MPKVGDTVRYLNSVGGGRILRISGNMAYVDDDGFETPVLLRECVVVRTAEEDLVTRDAVKRNDPTITTVAPKPSPTRAPAASSLATNKTFALDESENDDNLPEEVPGGDNLNLVLGFEPVERTQFSKTDFDASLINDSNYYLYFSLSSREADAKDWTCRYAGMVEPNTELWLGTFERTLLGRFERMSLQFIAFKRGRNFKMKEPMSVEIKVDTTRFFKLHCYQQHRYFENPVLAFPFVTDNRSAADKTPDLTRLREPSQMKGSTVTDSAQSKREGIKTQHSNQSHNLRPKHLADEPLVVDLHIEELVDNRRGMSSADMLNLQVDTFRKIMDENLRNFGRKIVFIHGKGEGVLRHALLKELTHRYAGHDVQDASFMEYGFGATQVIIRQHADRIKNKSRKK